MQSLLLHVKNGLTATLRISGQQIQFCTSCWLTLVKSCFSAADTGGFSSCEALPIKVVQFTFCECVEVSFFDNSNAVTPYRQQNRPTVICKHCITDELGGLFWGMCASPFHLIVPLTLKFPVVDFMRELTMVTLKGSCTSYWKVMVWLGRS